jgi:Sulfotransferase family
MNYSFLDQAVHRLAFGAPHLQITLCEIEDSLFENDFKKTKMASPIFVTSLPRAGTTILLEALEKIPGLASHRYSDMPFVYAPRLWSTLSASFRKNDKRSPRAHGDGIAIGIDSPEAFEEIFWLRYWPEKYRGDRIQLWEAEPANPEFDDFMIRHMRKIVALRQPTGGRYISKNNANIARLDYLSTHFVGASIIVPFRDPIEQARSLLRQHENFSERHLLTPFVKRYMNDIGHFEFGELHRPIDFPGVDRLVRDHDPHGLDYWISYWIAAYRYILEHAEDVILVPLEKLRQDAEPWLVSLLNRLGVDADGHLREAARCFGPAKTKQFSGSKSSLAREARQIHDELDALSTAQLNGKFTR